MPLEQSPLLEALVPQLQEVSSYELKGDSEGAWADSCKGLARICTETQIARLGYNICAACTVFPALEKEPADLTDEDCEAVREQVLKGPLQDSVGVHDKCDACHPNLKELCPEATARWCPCSIQEVMREGTQRPSYRQRMS